MQTFKLYDVPKYYGWTNEDLKNIEPEQGQLKDISSMLNEEQEHYHHRVNPQNDYILYGDIDKTQVNLEEIRKTIISELKNIYNLEMLEEDFKYTQNTHTAGSYHFFIPKFYASAENQKILFTALQKSFKIPLKFDNKIYSAQWFRCPNQQKGIRINQTQPEGVHEIKVGTMEECLIDNISDNSINITELILKKENETPVSKKTPTATAKPPQKENEIILLPNLNNENNEIKTSYIFEGLKRTCEKLFDNCFNQERFNNYDSWLKVAFAIKNRFGDDGYDLFEYFSNKGSVPDSPVILKNKYMKINNISDSPITIKTIFYYAKEDNCVKYVKIMSTDSLFSNLYSQYDIARLLQTVASDKFTWVDKKLYAYDGKIWHKNGEIQMRNYISTHLYNFVSEILTDCHEVTSEDLKQASRLKLQLKTTNFKKDVVQTSQEVLTRDDIEFNHNPLLFAFNNTVYDLEKDVFRDFEPSDYITLTTGYDWMEPEPDKIKKIEDLLQSVMPIEDERTLLKQIYASGLDGFQKEKFIILNGGGRNGKGLFNDLFLSAIGDYGMMLNESVLCERRKTGACPELANIIDKRYVVTREPPANAKIQNSIVKNLTGGGNFAVRGLYESQCEKKLSCTLILEANKKPLLAEAPQTADVERIIDLLFRNIFVSDPEQVDEENGVFLGNEYYKTTEFKKLYRCAFLKVIMDQYKQTKNAFNIPHSVKERTQSYLESSSDLWGWFSENFEITDNEDDFIKIIHLFDYFKESEFYKNLSHSDKRANNQKNFTLQISENCFIKKYYRSRYRKNGANCQALAKIKHRECEPSEHHLNICDL